MFDEFGLEELDGLEGDGEVTDGFVHGEIKN
jgi:hypothetical protein